MKGILVVFISMLLLGCSSTSHDINYGLSHYQMGIFQLAAPRLLHAVPELEKTSPQDSRVTRSYLALGVMAQDSKLYDKAEVFLKKALTTAKNLKKENELHVRNASTTLGNFYLNRERFEDAIPHLKEAVDVSLKALFDPMLIAMDIDNLAVGYAGLKQYDHAFTLSSESLKLVEDNQQHEHYVRTKAVALYNRGELWKDKGDTAKAISAYDESIELLTVLVKDKSWEQWRLDVVTEARAKLTLK